MDAITVFVRKHISSNWLRSGIATFLLLLVWQLFTAGVSPTDKYVVTIFGWVGHVLDWVAIICLGAFALQAVTGRRSGER